MKSFLLYFLTLTILSAQQPYNSNLLVTNRIDPDILNTAISSTHQKLAYRAYVTHKIQNTTQNSLLHYFFIVDPYPSYGTEFHIQVDEETSSSIDISDAQKSLDKLMGLQLRTSLKNLYKEDSFAILLKEKNETIISFALEASSFPRELKHFRDMQGTLFIKNGLLQKTQITNTHTFELRGVEVNNFKKIVYFQAQENGGYLISKEELLINGTYKDQPYKESMTFEMIEYWNTKNERVTFHPYNEKLLTLESRYSEKLTNISVELDRLFPLLGKEARKAGYDLPKPFGITFINMMQDTTMHMTSFKAKGTGLLGKILEKADLDTLLDGDSTYRSLTYAPLIRADVWVLPFVSFGIILGVTDTNTDIKLASKSSPNFSQVTGSVSTNSLLYGIGATVAGGFDNYFTTIDFQYIIADTPSKEVKLDMMIITPLIGYDFKEYKTQFFIGAQYQRLAESLTFALDYTDRQGDTQSLEGEIGLISEEWAGVIGANYSFTRNWSSNILYSQGKDRKNMTLTISYRW